MFLTIRIMNFGNEVEIRRDDGMSDLSPAVKATPPVLLVDQPNDFVGVKTTLSFLTCLFIEPCGAHCVHRASGTACIVLSESNAMWLVELLTATLHCGDALIRRRIVTLLGMIGSDGVVQHLLRAMNDSDEEVRYAVMAALRRLGYGYLLAEWNYV